MKHDRETTGMYQMQELEGRTLASATALPAVQYAETSLPAVQQSLNQLPAVQSGGSISLPAVQINLLPAVQRP